MPYRQTNKTENQKSEHKKQIMKAAGELFSEIGYHSASVQKIMKRANLSVGTFYLYFKNKEDILEKIYDDIADLMFKVANEEGYKKLGDVASRFARATTSSFCECYHQKELFNIFIRGGINEQFRLKNQLLFKRIIDNMISIFDLLKDKNLIVSEDTVASATAYSGTVNQTIIRWLEDDCKNMLDTIYLLVIYNLRALCVPFDGELVKKDIKMTIEYYRVNLEGK